MPRLFVALFAAAPLFAQCRLPDVAPGALARMSPAELVADGHFLRARRVLEPLAKERPDDPAVAWLLSRADAALGDLDTALKLAEAALAADPSNAAYHVQVAAVAARLAEKANFLKQLGYAKRAKQELDAAVALDPRNPDAQWGLMMYYFAVPALIGGDKAKSQQIGEQLAAAVPDPGRYYAGRLAAEMKDPEKTEALYKQAVLENPLSFDTLSALANFYMDNKPDQSRAERWACQAVHANPTRADAWALLARAWTLCGCFTEAVATAERSEAIDPENLAPYYAIASSAVGRGQQLEIAIAMLRKYMTVPPEGTQPGEAAARVLLGRALAQSGKNTEAAAEFRAALEQEPSLNEAKAELKKLPAESRH